MVEKNKDDLEIPNKGPELVIGLVGALGTDLDLVVQNVEKQLGAVGYQTRLIHLTKYLSKIDEFKHSLSAEPLEDYIASRQDAGNIFREKLGLGDALGRLAISVIRQIRKSNNGIPDQPISRCAYIIRQLKHPEEVFLLRSIYGPSFYLVAAYSPRDIRTQRLASKIANSHNSMNADNYREKAEKLIMRDRQETDNKYGQNVRDTFPEADVFFDASNTDRLRRSVERFIELIFGYPFHTPYADEFAMFHATAAAVRSADLARQVGAVITSNDGDVIAVGTNEVPKAGGGLYWAGDVPDYRDFVLGKDNSREMKKSALGDVLERLQGNGWLSPEKNGIGTKELIERALPIMRGTRLMGIGEFGRTVHAEMAALLDAARRGVSVQGQTLYTTTYPCHNCARHIIGTGINRVVYIEPYPKSLASVLHSDSIIIESCEEVRNKVVFEPFVGIAPRQYLQLFSMARRRDDNGEMISWKKYGAVPRFPGPTAHLSYTYHEVAVLEEFRKKLDSIDS